MRPTSVVNVRHASGACLIAATLLAVAGCGGLSPASVVTSTRVLTSAACSLPSASTPAGTRATPGSDEHGGSTPVWSAADGRPSVVVGGTAYGTAEGRCITAIDVATGRVEWSVTPPSDHPELFDVIADASVVLAATGAKAADGPGLVVPVVDELVAYDPTTGHAKWGVVIPGDSQVVPGLLTGSVVVVSQADGSLVGLSEVDGHQLWHDPAPKGCSANGTMDGAEPNAVILGPAAQGGIVSAVVGHACPAGGDVAAIDPSNGTTRWTWRVPNGWELDTQVAMTVDNGSPTGFVVAAAISLVPPANAPAHVAAPPGPVMPTQIPNLYNYSQTTDVVVLDPGSGRTLWDLTDVVGQLLTAGGAGTLCVLTDAGADCRSALDGAPRWSITWPGSNASPSAPALGCIDESAVGLRCAVSAHGLLYVAVATASAPAYPPGPGPATPAGAFQIAELSMATGKTTTTIPLPSFNNSQSDHAVSLAVPPAVLVVGDGMVLVTPQFGETDVVQAFTDPSAS